MQVGDHIDPQQLMPQKNHSSDALIYLLVVLRALVDSRLLLHLKGLL